MRPEQSFHEGSVFFLCPGHHLGFDVIGQYGIQHWLGSPLVFPGFFACLYPKDDRGGQFPTNPFTFISPPFRVMQATKPG
jgi:hypothetical protein